jgi:hypothetical protein
VHQTDIRHYNIHGTGEGQITSFNPITGQATTAGVIETGILRGTTAFSAQFIDAAGDYVGMTTITTKHGILTLTDVGNLSATGVFTDTGTITGGTGKFAGASGTLFFRGHELADGVHFIDDNITGTIDVP